MQKVTQIPSCLTDSAIASLRLLVKVSGDSLTQSEGYRRVRRSAAMIGLAISMSATGMVLSHKATATTGTASPQVSTLADLSNSVEAEIHSDSVAEVSQPRPIQSTTTALKAPALKYEVQEGESIWKISQEFQVQPSAIASSNKISTESDLVPGQTIKIPVSNVENTAPNSQPLQTALAPSVIQNPRNLNSGLRPDPLQSTKDIQSDRNIPTIAPIALSSPAPETKAIADVADVSQPIEVIPADQSGVRQNAASGQGNVAIGNFSQPIPIAVPTPESVGLRPVSEFSLPQVKAPVPLSAPSTVVPLPRKLENNSSNQSSESLPQESASQLAVSRLEAIGSGSTPPQTSVGLNVPISVPTPETPSLSRNTQWIEETPRHHEKPPSPIQQQEIPTESTDANNFSDNSSETYAIKPGDTINSIAKRYGLDREAVIKANRLSDPNLIQVNQKLVIPSAPQTQVTDYPVASALPIKNNHWQALPVPVALAAPKIAVKAIEPAKTIPISVDAPTVTYTNQLKSEVATLQQSYGSQSRPLTIPVQTVAQVASRQDVLEDKEVNPEWSTKSNVKRIPTRSLPNQYTPPQTSLQKLQRQYSPAGSYPSQIIGAAPIDVEEYNNNFQTPVGKEVSPDLPALSTPDFPNGQNNLTNNHIWPAKGVLSSGYGRRWGRMHRGIDIAAPIGTPIVASAPGEVIAAGWNSGGYGNLVKIRHPDGSVTFYAHNSRILVRTGEEVAQGQQISEMGSTGRSTGPHLHFEVRPNGQNPVNPIAFLPNSRY
jgi:murein DD-endopeptidase MepM/ murein hydrolase activator NlpD